WRSRGKAKQTAAKLGDQEHVTGAPRLAELLTNGAKVVDRARQWLGLSAHAAQPGSGPYLEQGGRVWWRKTSKEGPGGVVMTPLANFTARIVADVTEDDGAETRRAFEIEATLTHRTSRFTMPADRFTSMGWAAEHLGAMAIIYPGSTVKDHTRTAIQEL